ncbi:hypothetical protein HBO11_05215 [Pseudomonas sp. WS 5010]|jgi:hypothetical protein|uniref:hypothetical protein n=1 Tax=Pseudomonas sp. WS 5010 TaxID=2717489 RepID=UPI0014753292|nr:hypothetical protein [Pseudomonas sp. WS 5010]NMX84946.1 hypothetical protein [Pseudomonas sp. WS 5010]
MVDGVFKRLANIFSPSDSKSEGSQEPLYLTPDGKRLRNMGPVTAKLRPEAIKNWSHPFKEKSNPLEQLTQLANAASGSYPLGVGGLWHGGVHFDSGTLSSLDKASVHCIADGEVVAYCIDRNSAKTVYVVNKLHLMKPYSRNFVLVRHRLEPPAIEGETESPPRSLFFYSLYMHLQDGATYEGDLTIDRPSFWPESKICFVPETAKDVSTGTPEQYGLNVRHRAHQGKVLGFLPRGAQVTISGEGDFRKLGKFLGPSHLLNKDGSLLGYIDFDRLESVEGGEYRLNNQLNVHVDATPKSKTIGQKLPAGTQVKVSGEGEFRKLEHVTQYVYFKSLQSLRTPRYDCVNVLDEPIPIKAGELIGHIGWYQDYAADKPEKKLHLEVFSEEDVDQFIRECREWAPKLPATSKTWLKLVKGTPVVAHQDHFSTKQLPTLSTADAVSGGDLLIPKSLLDSLPTAEKITVPATEGCKAYNWYRLNQLLNDTDNKLLNGWVREEVGVTPWVSPWEWHGYAVITDYTSVPAFMAAFLRSLKRFTDQQLQRYGALADAGDSGQMKERLYDIIDRDGNKKMTAEEIQAAIQIPAHAQSISRLIICCESEWYYKPQKWDGLDEMFGHGGSTPHINWLAEKERIKQLSWWDEVAEKVGLPADGKVYHLHPIGLMGSFYNSSPCMPLREAIELALKVSGGYEGRSALDYHALADDFDKQGTSFGLIQWNFGQGTLGPVLLKMLRKDGAKFADCFPDGTNYETLKTAIVNSDKEAQLSWVRNILRTNKAGWKQLFLSLGDVPDFQEVQLRAAAEYHSNVLGCIKEMRRLSPVIMTSVDVMSYVALYDLCVQQGGFDKGDTLSNIGVRVKAENPGTQEELLRICVQERAKSASSRWKADAMSRRMGIIEGYPYLASVGEYSTRRDNKNFHLVADIRGRHVCDI